MAATMQIDYRGALTQESRQRFGKELVVLQPDFILSGGTTPTRGVASANAQHPHRYRQLCRSGRQWLGEVSNETHSRPSEIAV